MKPLATLIMILSLLTICLMVGAQNLITNGSFTDFTNGLGDNWSVGPYTNVTYIDNGTQNIGSTFPGCSQAYIEQVINYPSTGGNTFKIEVDLQSNRDVYIIFWKAFHSGHQVAIIPCDSTQMKHYTITWTEPTATIYGINFCTAGLSAISWLKIDNVEMFELTTTGISEQQQEYDRPTGIFNLLGQRLPSEPASGLFIKNGKKYSK